SDVCSSDLLQMISPTTMIYHTRSALTPLVRRRRAGGPPVPEPSAMIAIINVILPIFALMGLGFGAVRMKLFPAEGIKSLIAFVNNFATRCLLFHSLVTSAFAAAFNPAYIGPFYIGALTCFVLGIVIALRGFGNSPGVAVSVGFSGMFTNTVLVGLPIILRVYGVDALPVVLSI